MTHTTLDAETRSFLLNGERLRTFLERLSVQRRKTIRLARIWSAFTETYDDLPDGPQRRVWLLAVLEKLSDMGSVELPVRHGKQWDRTSAIMLPTVVTLKRSSDDGERLDWRGVPWHPKLQWILQRQHVSPSDATFLQRVHQGLVEGWFNETEPFKYRSLQLTGDEKRLATLCKGALFGPGKLSLEMLGCEAEILPLAVARISSQSTMLMFENAAPFLVARSVLFDGGRTRIGCVGYGGGKQLIKSVGYFSMIDPAVREILYVGDLDAEGIQIAADVRRRSTEVPVRPAASFHLAMFESAAALGSPNGWAVREGQSRQLANSVIEFLDSCIRDRASRLIESGRRIPEEVISHSMMRRLVQDL